MRFNAPSLVVAILGATVRMVHAGMSVRGAEALYIYNVYRMDVEISAARALADGSWSGPGDTREVPWKIGRYLGDSTVPEDYPNGRGNHYGLNFHAFIRLTQGSGSNYPRNNHQSRIADDWMPTLLEVKNLPRFPPDSGELMPIDSNTPTPQRYTFSSFDLHKMLGATSKGAGLNAKNPYFWFDNVLKILGKRAAQLYELDPARGAGYFNNMKPCLRESHVGRTIEIEPFKQEGIGKDLVALAKQQGMGSSFSRNWIKTKEVTPAENIRKGGDETVYFSQMPDPKNANQMVPYKYTAFDSAATSDAIKKNTKKQFREALQARMKVMAKEFGTKGPDDENGKPEWILGDEQNVKHENVRKQVWVLKINHERQQDSATGSASGCGYKKPADPKPNQSRREASW
ncbi:hypothetical protein VD0002_g7857 [Verticillium dahliae]|uniref:Heme haloperoxidase family profile domain-containing protein n=2 Tax=Verticillium dahliae TaxID=27337 RepID=G2XA96_VERDV|nr:uncharacterized protein VDAG_06999 [Verticillium dahliae VdLs.17]KAF3343557.1 Magnesium transporter protein 1 [Verticillium dahliae VDG2]KAH6702280.1 hypothetical protein EV126DRAFT_337811 [Verticillium dahliae]EGY15835.1 hypothetical protein VDAG_06999 [Verticillium dahliae VdLs.17]PNH36307.1 hypothetical protein BJF96_g392 [Verticillium dahliae]PNH53011.1 hypothetical protein VD0003_g4354 [Verticillium dahliae]